MDWGMRGIVNRLTLELKTHQALGAAKSSKLVTTARIKAHSSSNCSKSAIAWRTVTPRPHDWRRGWDILDVSETCLEVLISACPETGLLPVSGVEKRKVSFSLLFKLNDLRQ